MKLTNSTHPPGKSIPASWLIAAQFSSLVILCFFILSDKLVTRDYTICSESNNIFTVDEANPRVECVLVRGSIIHDTGSLGIRVLHQSGYSMPLIVHVEDIERRRTQSSKYPGVLAWALRAICGKTRIIRVKPESIVVPGLAGGIPLQFVNNIYQMFRQTHTHISLNMVS